MRRESCHSVLLPLGGTLASSLRSGKRHRIDTFYIYFPPPTTSPATPTLPDVPREILSARHRDAAHSTQPVRHEAISSRGLRRLRRRRKKMTRSASLFSPLTRVFSFRWIFIIIIFFEEQLSFHDAETQSDNNRLRNKSAAFRTQAW